MTAILVVGCADSGVDMEINAPILEAVGVNVKEGLLGKPAPEPDLPEHAPLVLPPQNASLPVPGQAPQAAAANQQQWPVDPEDSKKQAAKLAKEKKDQYCQNGDWNKNGNIDEFRKNVGQDARCRPGWVDNILNRNKKDQ